MRVAASILLLIVPAIARAAPDDPRLQASLAQCWSCHGPEGLPKDPTIPIIRGQRAAYLERQLRAYRSGERDSQIMSSMAESLPAQDLQRAAQIVSAYGWPERQKSQPVATAPASVEACKACHGDHFQGGVSPDGPAPRLAGQFAAYLGDRMDAFASEGNPGAPTMTMIMKSLSAGERADLATYLAGL